MSGNHTAENGPGTELAGYRAAREGAAWLDRRARGRIVLSGADRATYLQGLLTNDIVALRAGSGCYASYLTAQGRMISDMWLFELGDVLLMTLPGSTRETVLARLDQFIFSEDVQLGDVTDTFASIAVAGPGAARVIAHAVEGVAVDQLAAMAEGGNARGSFSGEPAIVLRAGDLGVPGFELLVAAARFEAAVQALRAAGAVELSADAAEALRVEGGVPRFHQDMDETTIPLEANLERRAISLTKGCYVGQEVIIRVLHRGHGRVAKKLVGLTLSGSAVPATTKAGTQAVTAAPAAQGSDAASAPEPAESGGKNVPRITSAVFSPTLQRPIALAYVPRDAAEPGTEVLVNGLPAVVTALPFV